MSIRIILIFVYVCDKGFLYFRHSHSRSLLLISKSLVWWLHIINILEITLTEQYYCHWSCSFSEMLFILQLTSTETGGQIFYKIISYRINSRMPEQCELEKHVLQWRCFQNSCGWWIIGIRRAYFVCRRIVCTNDVQWYPIKDFYEISYRWRFLTQIYMTATAV